MNWIHKGNARLLGSGYYRPDNSVAVALAASGASCGGASRVHRPPIDGKLSTVSKRFKEGGAVSKVNDYMKLGEFPI